MYLLCALLFLMDAWYHTVQLNQIYRTRLLFVGLQFNLNCFSRKVLDVQPGMVLITYS